MRVIALPVAVDGALANVIYSNGVIVVTLPVASQTRPQLTSPLPRSAPPAACAPAIWDVPIWPYYARA